MVRCSLSLLINKLESIKRYLPYSFVVATLLFTLGLHAAVSQPEAGKAIMAKGDVNAMTNMLHRALARRSPIFARDVVTTGELSASQFRMIDGALLSMQAGSELTVSDYQFDPQTRQGSVNMSLLKGGLKTITGSLQQGGDAYKLLTPVASIGVRGTHYEAEIINEDLYLAAWKGIIDVQVTVGSTNALFSLGPLLPYKFAIVRADGTVEFLLQTPKAFSTGYSPDWFQQNLAAAVSVNVTKQLTSLLPSPLQQTVNDTIYVSQLDSQKYIDSDQYTASWLPSENRREGVAIFDQVVHQSIKTSQGEISDFTMSLTIDFDTAKIPTGHLSFSDSVGEWFAAFDGIVNDAQLDLSVNFAAHNNHLVSGNIDGILIDQAKGILGNLSLYEINNIDANASGSFELRQVTP